MAMNWRRARLHSQEKLSTQVEDEHTTTDAAARWLARHAGVPMPKHWKAKQAARTSVPTDELTMRRSLDDMVTKNRGRRIKDTTMSRSEGGQ